MPPRAMHLAERGRGDGHGVDRREHLLRLHVVRRGDLRADGVPRDRRHLVGELAERREVGLGDEVRARGEDLRELHEGRPEVRDARHQRFRPRPVERRRAMQRTAPPEPAAPVAEQGDDEGPEGEDDPEGVHLH
ncbi:MAG: hypothetical protein IPJ78_18925 [Gemmatimonadetes bacterium]|nr:hypothetical protein [Gemmatimonadota bacterium]